MKWSAQRVLELGRSYQGAAVLAAAADLELFDVVGAGALPARELAGKLNCDERGLSVLLDALVALGFLEKQAGRYSLAEGVGDCLTARGAQSVLAMAQHQANCMRRWAQLARSVKTGGPAECASSVRGEAKDQESFIGAMDNVSAPVADDVIRAIEPLEFRHLLDVGGASGTWTLAFLRAWPDGRATLFDLPEVIPIARQRFEAAGKAERVSLVPGDFMKDVLPSGADLAWVSAIVHQNSREQNRELFRKVHAALVPGGRIAIRDIIMDSSRTRPTAGALFAANMLVATEGGGTFTFDELREDLEGAGFGEVRLAREAEDMNGVLVARGKS